VRWHRACARPPRLGRRTLARLHARGALARVDALRVVRAGSAGCARAHLRPPPAPSPPPAHRVSALPPRLYIRRFDAHVQRVHEIRKNCSPTEKSGSCTRLRLVKLCRWQTSGRVHGRQRSDRNVRRRARAHVARLNHSSAERARAAFSRAPAGRGRGRASGASCTRRGAEGTQQYSNGASARLGPSFKMVVHGAAVHTLTQTFRSISAGRQTGALKGGCGTARAFLLVEVDKYLSGRRRGALVWAIRLAPFARKI
jgi:hypothetical protein